MQRLEKPRANIRWHWIMSNFYIQQKAVTRGWPRVQEVPNMEAALLVFNNIIDTGLRQKSYV